MIEKRFLIVFAKEPRIGRVKTRLQSCLPKRQVLDVYKAFLRDTVAMTRQCGPVRKIMAYDHSGTPRYLKRIAPDFIFYRQQGRNLGQRLHNAFVFAADQGADKTVIIGSDSPDLPAGSIKAAFQELSRHNIVWGPTQDGGYYLVALKNPMRKLFQGIKWSTSRVLEQSLKKAGELDQRVFLLKPWRDVDRPKDLRALRESLRRNNSAAHHTRRLIYGKAFTVTGHHNAI